MTSASSRKRPQLPRDKASALLLLALLLTASLGFAFDEPHVFEVASIAHHPRGQYGAPLQIDSAQFRASGWSVLGLIRYAYGVERYQIAGPGWIATEMYDVWAKLPEGATKQDVPVMVRTLLAERFQMKMHWATREAPAYALVVRQSGLKLKPSTGGEAMRLKFSSAGYINARSATLADFSGVLTQYLHRPVLDRSGVEGRFDIEIEIGPDLMNRFAGGASASTFDSQDAVPEPESMGAPIFTVLRGLGLELRSIKAPIKYLVIDAVEKEFTKN